MESYAGSSYKGNTAINYNVFASANPLSGNQQSCYSFSQQLYEMTGGTGNTFVDEFSNEQLDQLNNNIIDVFYGDLDAGRLKGKVKETMGKIYDGFTEAIFPSTEVYDGSNYNSFLGQNGVEKARQDIYQIMDRYNTFDSINVADSTPTWVDSNLNDYGLSEQPIDFHYFDTTSDALSPWGHDDLFRYDS